MRAPALTALTSCRTRGPTGALIGRLRRARRSDAPALLALKRRAYGKCVARIGAAPQPMAADYAALIEDHANWLIDDPGGAGLLAALVLRAEEDALVLWSVAVAPAAQGQDLGRRLLAFAEAEVPRAGRRRLRLFSNERFTENLALYRRLR